MWIEVNSVDLNRVVKRNKDLEWWTRRKLFITSAVIFAASIIIGAGFLEKKPEVKFASKQQGKNSHSGKNKFVKQTIW